MSCPGRALSLQPLSRGWVVALCCGAVGVIAEARNTRILFGSCNQDNLEQPLWEHIDARGPDVWIWGGDAIYGDRLLGFELRPKPKASFEPATPERLRALYSSQRNVPGYARLVNSSVRILGTWDDHDFGDNDGDRTYAHRHESQAAFLDFLGEPPDSPRRRQKGVYAAHRLEFAGGSVLVIALDMRFHKDPYGTPSGDFLGAEQWRWLEKILSESTARMHIVVSSLPMLEPRLGLGETWNKFPLARARLLKLLTSRNLAAPLVISGDIHLAEMNEASCVGTDGKLIEVTSSGMTHSWNTRPPNINNFFVSKAMWLAMELAQRLLPLRYQTRDAMTGDRHFYLGLNFGEIDIDWARGDVTLRIIDVNGVPRLERTVGLNELDMRGDGTEPRCEPARGAPARWRGPVGLILLVVVLLSMLVLVIVLAIRVALWGISFLLSMFKTKKSHNE